MNWTKKSKQEPEMGDLPFVAYNEPMDCIEFFEDMDWFSEFTEEERLEFTHWMKIEKP